MKKLLPTLLFLILSLTSCDGFSYTVPTFPAPPPTITPSIYSPTPVIVTVTSTPEIPIETATEIIPTETLVFTEIPTLLSISQDITVNVLGCNTSIDITHGMGEVTNAFVTLQNKTGQAMGELCTTLFALDEGRIHPDKKVCIPLLEYDQQVTLKLTVDSTYKQETPIQIEVKSGETLLSRVASPSCTDIGLLAPNPALLLTPVAIP